MGTTAPLITTEFADLIARWKLTVGLSKARCERSRFVLASSRELTRRFRRPSGASDAHDLTVQARIGRTLEKTRRGGLPAAFESKLWAGRGTLAVCNGCDDKIESSEHEYEIDLNQTITFRFHAACYHAWRSFPTTN